MQKQPGNVGVTGGIAIGAGVTLFALITFPPMGIIVGLVFAGIVFARWDEHRHQARKRAAHQQRIQTFYERGDQRVIDQSWSNPGWRV